MKEGEREKERERESKRSEQSLSQDFTFSYDRTARDYIVPRRSKEEELLYEENQ